MSIDNVEDLPARVQYVAAAAQTDFDYPFPIFTNADLIVDVDGVTKVLTTNYTMTGAGNDTGGTVTFGTPMSGGEIVTLYRQIAIERLTDIQQNGPWSSTAYNDEQDKTYLLLQQLNDRCNLALRLPATVESDTDSLELDPSNFASKYLAFDANGRPEPAVLSDTTMTASIVRALLDAATNISHTSAEPRIVLTETGENTDRRIWDIDIDGHVFTIRTRTDADGTGKNVLSVTRGTTTDIASIDIGYAASGATISINGIPLNSAGSFTGTLTGCTTSPTATFYYRQNGTFVTILTTASLSGTSNATTMTVTGVPAAIQPAAGHVAFAYVKDNGTNQGGMVSLPAGSGTMTFGLGIASFPGNFTGSGTKGIPAGFSITYSLY